MFVYMKHQCTHILLNVMNQHITITEHMARTVVQIHDNADVESRGNWVYLEPELDCIQDLLGGFLDLSEHVYLHA